MDEKVLEEIKFHQDVVTRDASSPLFQIREKEMEIHGRILAARNQAENIVSDARQKAAEAIRQAEVDAEQKAKEHADALVAEAEQSVASVKQQGEAETVDLEKALAERQGDAVELVVRLVTSV